ncbi:MAG: histidine phosphatase family protein [Microbacteriaceae bacterium]
MTLIYFVRHGETEWNRERRIQGKTDIPLNDTGREQARATGKLLANRRWDLVVSSPLVRARETAEIIASELGMPAPLVLDDIGERNYGASEGLNYEQIEAKFPDDAPVPGRESRREVTERAIPAVVALAERYPEKAIIVVSHGGVIRSILLEVAPHEKSAPIRNGSIHSFRHTDGTLDLIACDDPIEATSNLISPVELDEQNPTERIKNRWN